MIHDYVHVINFLILLIIIIAAIVQILDNFFEAPFGGLGTTYDVHLRLTGKRVGPSRLPISVN